MSTRKKGYKVKYRDNAGRESVLFFGSGCTEEDVRGRIQAMRDAGWKILSQWRSYSV